MVSIPFKRIIFGVYGFYKISALKYVNADFDIYTKVINHEKQELIITKVKSQGHRTLSIFNSPKSCSHDVVFDMCTHIIINGHTM